MPAAGDANVTTRRPSILGGTAIIAGTAIGAGMFSLPVVSAGMGFTWSVLCLLLTWFCMLHSGLLILETNLNYPPGSSFDTFIGQTLGAGWNRLNNATLAFVLYILCYAFISGGGSIVSETLSSGLQLELAPMVSGVLFSLVTALLVWIGTTTVSRVSTVIIVGMVISFALSIAQLLNGVSPALLFDVKAHYVIFSFAALPVYLTSFGFHGIVPSLVKHYGKDPVTIVRCLIYGSLLTLLTYVVWQAATLGQIPRDQFSDIIAQGGNIGAMVSAISGRNENGAVMALLNTFANLAVISSFLGGALGLFDYVADKFGFSNSPGGRCKSALATFLPPTVASMFFPNGFIAAIGFAGLAATVCAMVIPALAAKVSREKLGNPLFRVWGGNGLIYALFGYAGLVAICHVLSMANRLPVFGR